MKWMILSLLIFCLLIFSCSKKATLIAPSNGEEVSTLKPHFEWEEVEGDYAYRIQISENSEFNELFVEDDCSKAYYDSRHEFKNNTTYYWRILCWDREKGRFEDDWSETAGFTVKLAIDRPVLISPINEKLVDTDNINISWEGLKEAAEYEIQVDYYNDFDTPHISQKTSGPSFITRENMNSGTYYWRVRGIDKNGVVGPWSETGTFNYINPKETEMMRGKDLITIEGPHNTVYGSYRLLTDPMQDVYLDLTINDEWVIKINGQTDRYGELRGDCEWQYTGNPDSMVLELSGIVKGQYGDNIIQYTEDRDYILNNYFEIEIVAYDEVSISIGGACPWLYTWDNSEYIKCIEIIRNLYSEEMKSTQVVCLNEIYMEDNIVKILVSEEKDEVSYIDEVVLIANGKTLFPVQDSENAQSLSYIDNEYIVLKKGDSIKLTFKIPFESLDDTVWMIRSTGYYIPEEQGYSLD